MWAVVAAGGVLILAWLWRAGMKPTANDLDYAGAVARMLAYLRDRGLDSGELRFQVRHDARRAILFKKHIIAPNTIQLQGSLCDDSTSAEEFDAVQTALQDRGLQSTTIVRDGGRCLVVEAVDDLSELESFVEITFSNGFGADVTRDGVAYFKNTLVANVAQRTGVDS